MSIYRATGADIEHKPSQWGERPWSEPRLFEFVEKRRSVRVFVFEKTDKLRKSLFGDETLHLFQVVGNLPVVASPGFASSKRNE